MKTNRQHETLSLPIQFRELKIDRSKVDEEKRTAEVLFSTDEPARRWWGKEKLLHEEGACDLSRMNDGGAFLKDHDDRQQIGVCEKAWIEKVGDGGEGRCIVRFAPATNQLAEQEFRDMLAGIRTKISVGYVVKEAKLTAEGEDMDDDEWTVTKWEVLEVSLVAIPLDKNCAIGRGADGAQKFAVAVKKDVDGESRVRDNGENNPEMKLTHTARNHFTKRAADNGGATGGSGGDGSGGQPGAGQRSAAEIAAERKQIADEERGRVREIAAIAQRAGCVKEGDKAIDDGTSVDAFRKWVFDNKWGNDGKGGARALETPSNGEAQRGGMVLAKSIGTLLVESEEYKSTAPKAGKRSATVTIPERASFRATLATGSGAGYADVTGYDRQPGIVLVEQQRLFVADLLSQGVTNLPTIRYMKEVSHTNAATTVAEGGTKPEASFELDETDAPVKKIAVIAKVTDEIFADFPTIASYIDARLPFMVMQTEEDQLLNGSGIGANITGILNTAGIQTQAVAGDTKPDAIHKAITKVRAVGFFEPDGVIMHPTDWQTLKLTKDANGQYYAGGPFTGSYGQPLLLIERIWGLPVVVTTAIAQGTALVGAFRIGAQIFRRTGITIETTNSNEDDFKKNLVAIRAEERLALCVYRPLAFCEVTGL